MERSNNFPTNSIIHVFSKPMLALPFIGEKNGFVLLLQGLGFEKLVCDHNNFALLLQHATCHKTPIHLV
jgi:hypothetical protein